MWMWGIESGSKPRLVSSKNDLTGTMIVLDGVGGSIKTYQEFETKSNGPDGMALVPVAAIARVPDQFAISLLGSL